jgi:hypothetical protein
VTSHTEAVLDRLRTEEQFAINAGDKPILARSFRFAIDEIERMNSALRLAHGVLITLVAPNPRESALHIYAHAVEAEAKVRAVLSSQDRGEKP